MRKQVACKLACLLLFLCVILCGLNVRDIYAAQPSDNQVNFRVTESDGRRVTLAWNEIDGAEEYKVEFYVGSMDSERYDWNWEYGCETTFYNVRPDTPCYFRLFAYNDEYDIFYTSQFVSYSYESLPVDFKVDRTEGDSVYLTWNSIFDAYEYQIDCYKGSMSGEVYWTRYSYYWYNNNEVEFYWLDTGEKYYFVLTAYDSSGETIYTSDSVSIYLRLSAPDDFTVTSTGALSVDLSWDIVWDDSVTGYRIYRSEDGVNYTRVKSVTDPYASGTSLTLPYSGKYYYYQVCAYSKNSKGVITNGNKTDAVKVKTRPLKQTAKASPNQSSSLKITWQAGEPGVDGYRIYRATSKEGTYSLVKTITDPTVTEYIDKGKTFNKYYYYKVRSYTYQTEDGERLYGLYSDITSCKVKLGTPSIKSIKLTGVTTVSITWETVTGAEGYEIFKAPEVDGECGGFKKNKTVTGQTTSSATIKGLSNGETYYYKIRAYKTIDGTKYYSNTCEIVSKLMYKLGYRNESWESRSKRVYGSDGSKTYNTETQARSHQKYITVKVWNIDSSGRKYTSTRTFLVNAGLAETYIQIFKEIYEGPEKFPIKDIGAYEWRGNGSSSEHCMGTAVDINSNENYMIEKSSGKILAGSLYKPGVNPYSIPEGGDVVKAFEKYGFYWGDWSNKRDYMHFSYFGT